MSSEEISSYNLDIVFNLLRLNRFDAKYSSSHVRKVYEIFIHTEKISRSSSHIAMIENDSLDIFILSQVFVWYLWFSFLHYWVQMNEFLLECKLSDFIKSVIMYF